MDGGSDASASGGCSTEGACLASQTDKNSGGAVGSDGELIDHPPDTPETEEDAGAASEGEQGFAESAAASALLGDLKGSEAVKLLDEELAELELLVALQRKKVDALGRLRLQWLSGDRCVRHTHESPDHQDHRLLTSGYMGALTNSYHVQVLSSLFYKIYKLYDMIHQSKSFVIMSPRVQR